MAFQVPADQSNQNKGECQYFGSSAVTYRNKGQMTPELAGLCSIMQKKYQRSHIDDVTARVAVVGPHVHVQQDLFVETSRKRGQRVLEAPRLLCN